MRFWMWRSAVVLSFWCQREKSQYGCTTTIPRVHNSPKMFLKVYSLLLPWAELSFAWIGAKIRPCMAKMLIFSLWISLITYSVQPTRLSTNSCRNRSKNSPRRGGSLPKGGIFFHFWGRVPTPVHRLAWNFAWPIKPSCCLAPHCRADLVTECMKKKKKH